MSNKTVPQCKNCGNTVYFWEYETVKYAARYDLVQGRIHKDSEADQYFDSPDPRRCGLCDSTDIEQVDVSLAQKPIGARVIARRALPYYNSESYYVSFGTHDEATGLDSFGESDENIWFYCSHDELLDAIANKRELVPYTTVLYIAELVYSTTKEVEK